MNGMGGRGVAFDAGSLWIADRANFTIRELALSTRAVTTRAGAAGQSAHLDGVGVMRARKAQLCGQCFDVG